VNTYAENAVTKDNEEHADEHRYNAEDDRHESLILGTDACKCVKWGQHSQFMSRDHETSQLCNKRRSMRWWKDKRTIEPIDGGFHYGCDVRSSRCGRSRVCNIDRSVLIQDDVIACFNYRGEGEKKHHKECANAEPFGKPGLSSHSV